MSELSLNPFPRADVNKHNHPPTPIDIDAIRAGLLEMTALPTTIQPDDTAAIGVSTAFALTDHRHALVAAVPSAIGADMVSAEGVATSVARSDHDHSSINLAWGIFPSRFESTTSTAALGTPTTTDMTMTNTVSDVRAYLIHVQTAQVLTSAASTWEIHLHADGTQFARADYITGGVGTRQPLNATCLYLPTAAGSDVIDLRIVRTTGAGTLTIEAGATVPRRLWMEDIGLR
jgi:hypothetical protein